MQALTSEIRSTRITPESTLRAVSMYAPPREQRNALVSVAAFGEIARQAWFVAVPLQIDDRDERCEPIIKRRRPIPMEVLTVRRPRPKRFLLGLFEPREAGAIQEPHSQNVVSARSGIVGLSRKLSRVDLPARKVRERVERTAIAAHDGHQRPQNVSQQQAHRDDQG